MALHFEELDFRATPIGDLMLRRRRMPQFGDRDIYEVKLGEHFLMTSLFHESEDQLAHKGLAACSGGELDVVVGGLGLGYTAVAALEDDRVHEVLVVDFLEAVIDWHRSETVPMGKVLNADPRCRYVHGDFFALARDPSPGFDPGRPGRRFDAILLDIDHTPTHPLHPRNAHLYTPGGLCQLAAHLRPGGVFALWADGEPEEAFADRLRDVFVEATPHRVAFPNPLTDGTSVGAVYVARVAS